MPSIEELEAMLAKARADQEATAAIPQMLRSAPAALPSHSEDKYGPTAWGNASVTMDFTCPSGQLCLIKKIKPEDLIKSGVIKDLNSLSTLVKTEHLDRVEGIDPADIERVKMEVLEDDEALANVLHVINRVVCEVVVRPQIMMPLGDVTNRKQGAVYADMVDLEDRMAIFLASVEGVTKLAPFRQGAAIDVASLDNVAEVPTGS